MRACIGRAFAWQEGLLALASIIQKFDLSLADPWYTLQYKSALTIKPNNLRIRATVRPDREHIGSLGQRTGPIKNKTSAQVDQSSEGKRALHILYGSNSGSSEAFAQRIGADAAAHGKLIRHACDILLN
jgi:cytochrome P450 / NADPH-cytochrome P450 reductase